MRQEVFEKMKSYPVFPVLLTMMDKNFSSLTIDTAVNSMTAHNHPQKAAEMLINCLQRPGITEKEFWRFLQEQVIPGTIFIASDNHTP